MDTRVFIMAASEDDARAWERVLQMMGMEIVGRVTNRISHDGSWTVRARRRSAEQQAQSRAS